nr:MetaGeneMark_Unknown Function [uncultured bacterium]
MLGARESKLQQMGKGKQKKGWRAERFNARRAVSQRSA